MICDTKWALSSWVAAHDIPIVLMKVQCLVAGSCVTTLAVVSPIEANIEGDIAAETTLVVDVFSAVARLRTFHLAKTKLF